MGSAIASPSTTPVAFVGRPRGPPRCKSAPLYHRAQVARPISQGLQGGETPFCARLRPVVPSSAVPHHPAPSHPAPFAAQPRRTPVPSHHSAIAPRPLRTPVPSRSSAIAPRPLRTPAPSHPGPSRHFFNRCHCFSRRHLPRKPTLIQPYSLRGNRWKSTTGQSLLTRCFFFSSC